MIKKRKKSVSFDAMVKFFLQYYDIPTKEDIKKILERIERTEQTLIHHLGSETGKQKGKGKPARIRKGTAAYEILEIIRNAKNGIGFSEIKEACNFDEKKLRNIIFRLNDLGHISRASRGIYIAVSPKNCSPKNGLFDT